MRTRVAACTALLVLAAPGTAWAHGTLRPDRVGVGVTLDALLVAGSEREGHESARMSLAVPPDFEPLSCRSPAGWTCSTIAQGFTWQRVTQAANANSFELTLRVNDEPGTYVFPLAQTYDDGETRTFDGPPGSDDEAPKLTVVAAGDGGAMAPAQSSAPPHPPSPTGGGVVRVPSAASPRGGAGPTARPTVVRTASASAAAASPVGSRTASAAASPLSSALSDLAQLPAGRRLEPSGKDDRSSPAGAIAAIAVAAGALAVVSVAVRRRRPARPPQT